ncbi:MAG: thiamine pyrophosphate-binding protein [Bryobacteraceae bacterium]
MPPSGANLLAECLYRHGTRHVFGMPGSHSTFIYDAIHQRGLQTILCRNEQAGAFMADGYARSTGRPGVVCTTAGPGATNALTGIAESFSDSVPVLLIAGQVNHDRIHQSCGRYHEIDLEGIFRPCVRFAATVMNNEQIPGTVNRAFESMTAWLHTLWLHTLWLHTLWTHPLRRHRQHLPPCRATLLQATK